MTQSKTIGITGGVGCGKSVVMEILKEDYGAALLYTDLIAHEVMAPGGICYGKIIESFGEEILSEDGSIDRRCLSGIVFADRKRLKILNELTHPVVIEETFRRIEHFKKTGRHLIAIESALFVEAKITDRFDSLWYVYADDETRIKRLMEGRNYSEEKTRAVMGNQKKDEIYARVCEYTIDNSHTIEETKEQIRDILGRMGVI